MPYLKKDVTKMCGCTVTINFEADDYGHPTYYGRCELGFGADSACIECSRKIDEQRKINDIARRAHAESLTAEQLAESYKNPKIAACLIGKETHGNTRTQYGEKHKLYCLCT